MIYIFGKSYCSFCKKAVVLCEENDIEYEYTDLDSHALHPIIKRLLEVDGFTTVPAIYLDNNKIGGFTDLQRIVESGELL